MKLNPNAINLSVPGIRVFANKAAAYDDGINLTIGQPDFPTPENVKQAAIDAINNNQTGYSHNAGLPKLREVTANFFNTKYKTHFAGDDVIVTNGASEGLDSLLRTILIDGDEVIIMSPVYSAYESLIKLNRGKPLLLDTSDNDFKPSIEALERLMTHKTKAVMFNYPSNPTGVSLDEEEMEDIVRFLKDRDIFIISDEIYSENSFEGGHISFASYPEIDDKTFLIHGLSKSHSMTGWRLGFILGPTELISHVLKVHLNNSICASLPGQYAAIEALSAGAHYPEEMNKEYIRRRDYLYDELTAMGFSISKPTGAFYIFPDISSTGLDDVTFATRLIEEEHVAVVPGSTFSEHGAGFIRISFANSMENLTAAMDKLKSFLSRLGEEGR